MRGGAEVRLGADPLHLRAVKKFAMEMLLLVRLCTLLLSSEFCMTTNILRETENGFTRNRNSKNYSTQFCTMFGRCALSF